MPDHRDRLLEAALACAAHPVSAELLGQHLWRLFGDEPPAVSELLGLGDLALAAAALAGQVSAHETLGTLVRRVCAAAASSNQLGRQGVPDGELSQQVLARLLMPGEQGEPPALERFAGRAPLEHYVRVVATRLAWRLARSARPQEEVLLESARLGEGVLRALDAEALLARAEVRARFTQALGEAVAGLPDRDRLILSLHHAHGRSPAEIAELYGVDRSTVARWLERARQRLFARLAEVLRATLPPGAEDDPLATIRELASQIELSLSRLLA